MFHRNIQILVLLHLRKTREKGRIPDVSLELAQSLASCLVQLSIDTAFMNCVALCNCPLTPGQSLGQVIASKLATANHARSNEYVLVRALGVLELYDQQILVRFGLPGYEGKPQSKQEDILIYLYTNWEDLQADSFVVETLKDTKFVRNANEFSMDLSKPKDLFDLANAILTSVFSGERKKFLGERFDTDFSLVGNWSSAIIHQARLSWVDF
ncbi:hypothetical protein LWI29_006705 [Acer saccharum]|uniref:Uncharacterized protein n=1 Tax=Acer saccharum TaxID=4024 RepID=A0AA39S6B5_ACESA|nr:hypothetical protein LWI29_006705 [Acer saccharum]